MIPSQITKRKLTYNQLRQAIQRLILQEQKTGEEILSPETVDLFIKSYLIKNTK